MILAALSLMLADTSHAHPTSSCATPDAALPTELAQWRDTPTTASHAAPGQSLHVATNTAIPLHIEQAGTYAIAVDIAAWIEVRRGDAVLQSVGHSHGPDCSTIRKIVRFTMEPGAYSIHLGRTEAAQAHLLIIRQP